MSRGFETFPQVHYSVDSLATPVIFKTERQYLTFSCLLTAIYKVVFLTVWLFLEQRTVISENKAVGVDTPSIHESDKRYR